jgi:PKD domain/Immunoglobulin I-set domain
LEISLAERFALQQLLHFSIQLAKNGAEIRKHVMKHPLTRLGAILVLLSATFAHGATLYVDLNSANPTPPYSDWSTAATNIQDAIDASSNGDQIWVTNGVYQSGGRVMAGTLTNRVALNKAITVRSVNGPFVTAILGAGATNGNAAVRCAWLTNNAALIGFTLTRGATRNSGDSFSLQSGGGVWCAPSNALVSGCVIVSNTSFSFGGGAYQGVLNACLISSNSLPINANGGAVYSATLNNCTVVSNACYGTASCNATNSIIYYNFQANYIGGGFSYCCTFPKISGTGNFTNAPQLFPDGIHLAAGSPCIGVGTAPTISADIFGNVWSIPPSIGCAENAGLPLVTKPQIQLTGSPVGFTVGNALVTGASPFTYTWLKDGILLQDNGHFSFTQSTNLVATGVNFADAGSYQLMASNAVGMATSAVAQVVIHCVNLANANPVSPYTNWDTAATNIQDAIAAAAVGEIVLVTNGVYATGGKSMDNVISNRVSIDKAILVQSANGPTGTMIQGAFDSATTNGPGAIRCVWMTNNSILSGFTVYGGATRVTTGSINLSMIGGGVLASSNSATVANCTITNNYASDVGGGAAVVTLNYCTLIGNFAVGSGTAGSGVANAGSGGGAVNSNLRNCLVFANFAEQSSGGGAQNCNSTNCVFIGNRAPLYGSGAYQGNLVSCTLVNNTSGGYTSPGGAAANATVINSIVYGNLSIGPGPGGSTNYLSCNFSYSDTDPLPPGTGNIDTNPQLLADQIHLSPASPCVGAGTTNGVTGTDLDGQTWNNPPSIGCDEWQPVPTMLFAPTIQAGIPSLRALSFDEVVAGQPPFTYFWKKDGALIEDNAHFTNSATVNLAVNNFDPEDAGAYQLVVSNSFGMTTSHVAQVIIHTVDAAGANPIAPYSTWSTAATQIQDAVNASVPGDIILVTNGIYTTGGKVMSGDLTNRVALDKAVTAISVNGYADTVIEGQWDPVFTNGPGAIRCAWIADGATLTGFTLRNGATRSGNDGGGAWLSPKAVISDCVLSNNCADFDGGGVIQGTVNNSYLTYNVAKYGGGACAARLNNCTIRRNHCLLPYAGAGIDLCVARNCVISDNYVSFSAILDYQLSNDSSLSTPSKLTNCCISPLPLQGLANTAANPLFLDDGFHLAPASSCRGAGNSLYASGNDLDGEPFANPPSIGCDETVEADLVGPLSVSFSQPRIEVLVNHSVQFLSAIDGRVSEIDWSFGDGTVTTNLGYFASHVWTNVGSYTLTLTAYNHDHPEGVSANITVAVDPVLSPQLTSAGLVGNSFQFTFSGQTNAVYLAEYATNLSAPVNWNLFQSFYSTGGVITIQNPATNTARFYRVQVQ